MFEGLKEKLRDLVRAEVTTTVQNLEVAPSTNVGGRTSMPESQTSLGTLIRESNEVDSDYPRQLLDVIKTLAIYNPDFSLALENIIKLASTKTQISIEGAKRNSLDDIENWYGGGVEALRTDLTAQLVLTGALSAESIINNSLSGIDKIVLVSPKYIYFKYDNKTADYIPLQKILGKEIRLDIPSYYYRANFRLSEKPYGTPPFIAALDNYMIDKDMVENLRSIIKKLGIGGFLEVLVKKPAKLKVKEGGVAETDSQYIQRLSNILADTSEETAKGISKGWLTGFTDDHQFNMKPTTANISGAKDLFQINTELKHSGLKQSPFLLGRNYSTTETLGRVVLSVLTSQITTYQQIVNTYMEYVCELHLSLQGKKATVKSESEKPVIQDEESNQRATGLKIDNQKKLYDEGIIDQNQRAKNLGQDKPALPEPRQAVETQTEEPIEAEQSKFNTESLVKRNDELDKLLAKYVSSTNKEYKKALDKVLKELSKNLSTGSFLTEDNVLGQVYTDLYGNWETYFIAPMKPIINKHIEESYTIFRKNKAVFGNAKFDIPNAILNTKDLRTIAYMQDVDVTYLGKFITKQDTQKRITRFVNKKFLEEGYDLGNKKVLSDFMSEFGKLLNLESWKIDQVLSTTVSRMRYQASMRYLEQAGVENYIRLSVPDLIRCEWCAELDGQTFSVTTSAARMDKLLLNNVEQVEELQPFTTTVKIETLKSMSPAQIQNKGIEAVPSHPHCRCTIVADI